jgi:hypothetical protein
VGDIKNTSLRLNLEKPTHQKAWNYLQSIDKSQFKSYSHAIAISVADYFERLEQNQADPYFENREREERFIAQIITAVESALEKTIPNFLTACLAGISRTYPAFENQTLQTAEIHAKVADDTISEDVDYDFVGG